MFLVLITSLAARATVLFNDSLNYPYTDGPIEGQGQWFTTANPPANDVMVTNNVIYFNATNNDYLVAPTTNGWVIPPGYQNYTYASFQMKVTQLPPADLFSNGDIACEFLNTNGVAGNTNGASAMHLFVDQLGTTLPGTFHLGIANYQTEFAGLGSLQPPNNFPEDLATDVWYTVVVVYDNNDDDLEGATLWVNPSMDDYDNWLGGDVYAPGEGVGFAFGNDTGGTVQQDSILVQNIRFEESSYIGNFEISNVLCGTEFSDVFYHNPPVIGIQPVGGTNFSGNPATFSTLASGVDVNYQWYDTGGALSDGVAYTGSQSNILTVNSLSASDTYYCKVTDFYGNEVTSSSAYEMVDTTLTAPFFTSQPANVTNNLFIPASFSNPASGTGPITYQWYFAPTNLPTVYKQLTGQTSSTLDLSLLDYTYQGSYYVVASSPVSMTDGPTNTITELAPLVATLLQLHNLVISYVNTPGSQYAINPGGTYTLSSNVTVSGYVINRCVAPGDGFGNTYAEFEIEDTNGYGAEIFCAGAGSMSQPPLGAYVTATGLLELYHSQMELSLSSLTELVTNDIAPSVTIGPVLGNSEFNTLAEGGAENSTVILAGESLMTFTNCYLYGGPTGQPFGASFNAHGGIDGIFTNNYTELYFTVGGPYNATPGPNFNTNTLEIYQFSYSYPFTGPPFTQLGTFYNQPIPTHVYQITGVYIPYASGSTSFFPEIEPSLLSDYVVNPPSAPVAGVSVANNGTPTVSWSPQVGSTYSVYGSTSLLGPWTQEATGLAYYPTNGSFTDVKGSSTKFYYISTP